MVRGALVAVMLVAPGSAVAQPAADADPQHCRDVVVSFTTGGTTRASKVRVTGISCRAARTSVIVPCLYQDRPRGWSVTRSGDRVTLRKSGARVAYTTDARGGCRDAPS